MPRDIDTMPPLEAQYAVEPPKPPLHQPLGAEQDHAPAHPAGDHGVGTLAGHEERGLQVGVDLEVPVVLGDLVHRATTPQHGSEVRQHVQAAELVDRPVHERALGVEVREVATRGDVAVTFEARHDLIHGRLVEVDSHDPGARRGEHLSGRPPDAPTGAGHDHALAFEA